MSPFLEMRRSTKERLKYETTKEEARRSGKKKRSWRKGEEMRTLCVSPTLKQQPINHRAWRCSKAMHGLFLSAKLSGCQSPPPKENSSPVLPPSFCPPILSCHTVFSSTSSHRRVVVRWVGGEGVYGCERSPPPGLDK